MRGKHESLVADDAETAIDEVLDCLSQVPDDVLPWKDEAIDLLNDYVDEGTEEETEVIDCLAALCSIAEAAGDEDSAEVFAVSA